MVAIKLDGLSKDFGAFRALDRVTSVVPKGAVGLLGPNGAGKSTLVKCLLGLVEPTEGSAEVLGLDIALRPLELRQRVGYFPEVECVMPGMSAVAFTGYLGELVGMHPQEAMKRAHQVLDYVGLGEARYRKVETFSTGMRQRAKLAQCLVHDPELLFLDEPTNGLDPEGRDQMLELVQDLSENCGKSLIYSSHLLTDVEKVCKQVLILRDGKVVSEGSIAELMQHDEEAWEVRFGAGEGDLLAELEKAGLKASLVSPGCARVAPGEGEQESPVSRRVFEAAHAVSIPLRAFRPMRSSLEDVFIGAVEDAAGGGA